MPSSQFLWQEFLSGESEVDVYTYIQTISEALDLIKPKNAVQDRKLRSAKQNLDKLKFETQKLTSERDYLQERLNKES
jgi:FtsZ-binding cell division protein ZapB